MTRIDINKPDVQFNIQEGNLFEVNTEDGVGHYPLSFVVVTVPKEGQESVSYLYPCGFLASMENFEDEYLLVDSRSKCNDFIDKVKAVGSINPEKWEIYQPEPRDLEAKWRQDFEEEQLERRHYGY